MEAGPMAWFPEQVQDLLTGLQEAAGPQTGTLQGHVTQSPRSEPIYFSPESL